MKKQKLFSVFVLLMMAVTGAWAQAPSGAINGKFTVNADGDLVYFAKGNLQATYNGSAWSWALATNQWDYIGYEAANTSIDGNGTISGTGTVDLFGWVGENSAFTGTAIYGITNSTDGAQYGNTKSEALKSDWGTLIGEGWRTLTIDEWDYVLNTRTTTSGVRYAKATVNGIVGLILLPDDWSTGYYTLASTNTVGAHYDTNVISSDDWTNSLEAHGAVFLPAGGYRNNGTTVNNPNDQGFYWSATSSSSNASQARRLNFTNMGMNLSSGTVRYRGHSVRLVYEAPLAPAPTNACGNGLTWELNGNVLAISYDGTGTGAMNNWDNENPAPWYNNAPDIKYVEIAAGVTNIGAYAFADCDFFFIDLPATVTSIGENAFSNIAGHGITILSTECTLPQDLLENGNFEYIFVPAASVATYQALFPEYDYKFVEIPSVQQTDNVILWDLNLCTSIMAGSPRDELEILNYHNTQGGITVTAEVDYMHGDVEAGFMYGGIVFECTGKLIFTSTVGNITHIEISGDTYSTLEVTGWTWTPGEGGDNGTLSWTGNAASVELPIAQDITLENTEVEFTIGNAPAPDPEPQPAVNLKAIEFQVPASWENDTTYITAEDFPGFVATTYDIAKTLSVPSDIMIIFVYDFPGDDESSLFMKYGGEVIEESTTANYARGAFFNIAQSVHIYYPVLDSDEPEPAPDPTEGIVVPEGGEIFVLTDSIMNGEEGGFGFMFMYEEEGWMEECQYMVWHAQGSEPESRWLYTTINMVGTDGPEFGARNSNLVRVEINFASTTGGGALAEGWTLSGNKYIWTGSAPSARFYHTGATISGITSVVYVFDGKCHEPEPEYTTVAVNGVLPGVFSVGASTYVRFSQGNLQATTADFGQNWTWAFADNQLKFVGDEPANNAITGNGTVSANGSVDLFCWSTPSTYYGIHSSENKNDYTGNFFDWGGLMEGNWRLLSKDELNYLLFTRTNAESLRGAVVVSGVVGYVLLPDDWTLPDGLTFDPSAINNYTVDEWVAMETAGAVCLVGAGFRFGSGVMGVGKYAHGEYVTSTLDPNSFIAPELSPWYMHYMGSNVALQSGGHVYNGYSVRLVGEVVLPKTLTLPEGVSIVAPVPAGITDKGNGVYEVEVGTEFQIQATVPEHYSFVGWSDLASTDPNYAANPRTITMNADMNISPILAIDTYTLTLGVNDSARGSVKIAPGMKKIIWDKAYLRTVIALASNYTSGPSTYDYVNNIKDGIMMDPQAYYSEVHFRYVPELGYSALYLKGVSGNTRSTLIFQILNGAAIDNFQLIEIYSPEANHNFNSVEYTYWTYNTSKGCYQIDQFPQQGYVEVIEASGNEVDMRVDSIIFYAPSDLPQGVTPTETPGVYTVEWGSEISFVVTPAEGYHLASWSNGAEVTGDTLTLTMTGELALTANFARAPYTYTLPEGVSIVEPMPAGITDKGNGVYEVVEGTEFQIQATIPEHYSFGHWADLADSAAMYAANPRTIVADSTMTIQPIYAIDTYTLTLGVNDPARGSVKITKAQESDTIYWDAQFCHNVETFVDHSLQLVHNYNSKDGITVTMDGYDEMSGWVGGFFHVHMTDEKLIFTSTVGNISKIIIHNSVGGYPQGWIMDYDGMLATWEGTPSATVELPGEVITNALQDISMEFIVGGSAGKFVDNHNGTYTVDYGTELKVIATPAEGYHLASWSNGAAVTGDTLALTVTGELALSANFEGNEYALSFNTEGLDDTEAAKWAVTPNPAKTADTVTVTYSGDKKVSGVAVGAEAGGLQFVPFTSQMVANWNDDYETLLTEADMPGFKGVTLAEAKTCNAPVPYNLIYSFDTINPNNVNIVSYDGESYFTFSSDISHFNMYMNVVELGDPWYYTGTGGAAVEALPAEGKTNEWTFTMPAGEAVMTPIYAEASIKNAQGETLYATLKEAFAAVQNGDTLKLEKDATISESLKNSAVEQSMRFVLDLNGQVIDGSDLGYYFAIALVNNGDEMLIIDSSADQMGGIKGMIGFDLQREGSIIFDAGRYTESLTGAKYAMEDNGWVLAENKQFKELEGGADLNDGFRIKVDWATFTITLPEGVSIVEPLPEGIVDKGNGVYEALVGTEFQISADSIPEHYHFGHWADLADSVAMYAANPRTIVAGENLTVEPIFAIDTYTLTLATNDSTKGVVSVEGAGGSNIGPKEEINIYNGVVGEHYQVLGEYSGPSWIGVGGNDNKAITVESLNSEIIDNITLEVYMPSHWTGYSIAATSGNVSGDVASYQNLVITNINATSVTLSRVGEGENGGAVLFSKIIVNGRDEQQGGQAEPITVTITNQDFPSEGNSFTKDGVTVSAETMSANYIANGTFSTTLGNITTIQTTSGARDASGDGWVGSGKSWFGHASSVPFSGYFSDMSGVTGIKFVITIEPTAAPAAATGIVDNGDGTYTVDWGTELTFVAKAADGYHVQSWSNGVEVNDLMEATQTITMTEAFDLSAIFAENPIITLASNDSTMGIVTLAGAGNKLTVEGSNTDVNMNVPIRTNSANDTRTMSQSIYPAALLSGIAGESISGMTYYISEPSTKDITATYIVKLMETEQAAFSDAVAVNTESATTVYTGTIDVTGNTLDIVFDQPFAYNGGNLLVEFGISSASQQNALSKFSVFASQGGSYMQYYHTGFEEIRYYTNDFLAKTTFICGGQGIPGVIDLGNGQYNVLPGTELTFVAQPAERFMLESWSNGAPVNGDSLTLTVTEPLSLTANFKYIPAVITLPEGVNIVAPLPAGITALGEGVYEVEHGTEFQITAVGAPEHYHFDHWADLSAEDAQYYANPRTVVADTNFTANPFYTIDTYTLTLASNDTTMGKLTVEPAEGIVKNDDGTYTIDWGTEVTFVAVPAEDYHLLSWGNGADVTADNKQTLTITDEFSLSAFFKHDTYILTVEGAEVKTAKFADGTDAAVVLNPGTLVGVVEGDSVKLTTTATYSSANVGEDLIITLHYAIEVIEDGIYDNEYALAITDSIYPVKGTIIEPMTPDEKKTPEEQEAANKEGFEIYAYGYCRGDQVGFRFHLNSGNPDQYKIDFADSRFTDIDWTDLDITGKDGEVFIDIPMDMPTGDYQMTVTFRDSRFDWLESNPLPVTFHVNLPETYVVALFDNVMAIVDTCECLTDIQWYHRNNASEPWTLIEGATGYYYKQEGGLTGEYFIKAKMNGVDTYTCPQDDLTLYGGNKKAKVSAYPNPVRSTTTVTIEDSDNYEHTLRIINLMGNEMMSTSFEGNTTTVDMDGYTIGNYIISVDGIVVKVMKQ